MSRSRRRIFVETIAAALPGSLGMIAVLTFGLDANVGYALGLFAGIWAGTLLAMQS